MNIYRRTGANAYHWVAQVGSHAHWIDWLMEHQDGESYVLVEGVINDSSYHGTPHDS